MSRQLKVGTLSYQFIDRYLVYTFNNITYKKNGKFEPFSTTTYDFKKYIKIS